MRLGEEACRLKLVCGCVESYSLPLDQWKRTRTSLKESLLGHYINTALIELNIIVLLSNHDLFTI